MSSIDEFKIGGFVQTYFEGLRSEIAVFPRGLRAVLPRYTRGPVLCRITLASNRAVGITVERHAMRDRLSFRRSEERLEVALGFPLKDHNAFAYHNVGESRSWGLNVLLPSPGAPDLLTRQGLGPILRFPDNWGLLEVSGDCDFRIVDLHFQHGPRRNPKLELISFLWVLTGSRAESWDPLRARRAGVSDARMFLFGIASMGDPRRLGPDSLEYLRRAVSATIAEYELLIQRTDAQEEEVQAFIADVKPALDASECLCRPKFRFGSEFVSDFLLRYPDGSFRFVELERPHDPVISGAGFSARAQHAIGQVRDWIAWTRSHSDPALNGTPLRHWVIIGLRERLSSSANTILAELNARLGDIEVRTFDDLTANLRTFLGRIGAARRD